MHWDQMVERKRKTFPDQLNVLCKEFALAVALKFYKIQKKKILVRDFWEEMLEKMI